MSKKVFIPIMVIAIIVLGIGLVIALLPEKENDTEKTTGEITEENVKPSKESNVEGTLEEIMTKVYAGIAEDELPMMLMNMEVTKEDIEYYVGTADIDFKEALVSESGVGSIAHSVVLVRLNDAKNAEDAVTKIKENADPRKWICVEASNVVVKSKGDLVILIMSNEDLAPKLDANFESLE